MPVEGSPGGREPGLRTGELAGLQSSGKGFGMAGRDDVLSCCSASCSLLDKGKRTKEHSLQKYDPKVLGLDLEHPLEKVRWENFEKRAADTCEMCAGGRVRVNKALLYSIQPHVCFHLIYP